MKKFDRGNRGDSDRNFRKGGFRNNDSRPITMHSAICASCKKTCEVPFRPNGDKPVYCRDCFAGRAAMGGERSGRKDFRKESGQFNQNENKFTSRQNFNPNSNSNQSDKSMIEDLKKQIDSMNVKLDKLTNTIQNLAEKMNKETPKVNVEKENKVEVEEKPVIFSKVKKAKAKASK